MAIHLSLDMIITSLMLKGIATTQMEHNAMSIQDPDTASSSWFQTSPAWNQVLLLNANWRPVNSCTDGHFGYELFVTVCFMWKNLHTGN